MDAIEGVYLSGSLVNEDRDEYSDIDLGIATRNTPKDFAVGIQVTLGYGFILFGGLTLVTSSLAKIE